MRAALHNGGVDPYAVLGVEPGADERTLSSAYKRAAKRWHPDRDPRPEAQERMAEINAAYDLLRDGLTAQLPPQPGRAKGAARAPVGEAGLWLEPDVRRALPAAMLAVLEDREPVTYVASSSTWKSPEVLLAVTDRRLLWLPGQAISPRVHGLRYKQIGQVEVRLRRPRRRVATLRIEADNGRGFSFGELRPEIASAMARHIAGHARASA